jgi:hypothetical protein
MNHNFNQGTTCIQCHLTFDEACDPQTRMLGKCGAKRGRKLTDNRVRIALHPEVFKMLEVYKDKIHDHATKRRVPLSWNDFIIIIVNDWQNGRTKCVCGTFYDCKMCDTEKALSRIKLGDY